MPPVTLAIVVDRAMDALAREAPQTLAAIDDAVGGGTRPVATFIARAVIAAMDFQIDARTGEIVDPRPRMHRTAEYGGTGLARGERAKRRR